MTNEELLALNAEIAANPHLASARAAGFDGFEAICNELNQTREKDAHITEDDVIACLRAAKAARSSE